MQTRHQSKQISSCGLCDRRDNVKMVQCDECDTWYHFDCVGLITISEEENWLCPQCMEEQNTIIETHNPDEKHDERESQSGNMTFFNVNQRRECDRTNDYESSQDENMRRTLPSDPTRLIVQRPSINRPTDRPIIMNEFITNHLHSNATGFRKTEAFNQAMSDRHVFTGNTPSQGVFVTQRQVFGICSIPTLAHSTPSADINRQFNTQQQPMNRRLQTETTANFQSRPMSMYPLNEQEFNQPERDRPTISTYTVSPTISSHRSTQSNAVPSMVPPMALSVVSSVQTMSTSRRVQLELQKLEEEKRAHQEYIERKYRILLQNNDGIDNKVPMDRRNYTEDWVSNVSSQQKDEFVVTSRNLNDHQTDEKRNLYMKPSSEIKYSHKLQPTVEEKEPEHTLTANEYQREAEGFSSILNPLGKQKQSILLDKSQLAARHVVSRDLPSFDGSPEDWPMFYSQFRNSTQLCGYSNAENLVRLQKCLKGRALKAVQHRLLLPDSVPQVISTLKMIFGRPEFIVNYLITQVTELPPPKMDKLDTIVDFAMSVQNVSATIESCELPEHLSNPNLITSLVNKLPVHIRLDWARFKMMQPVVTLLTFSDWLYSFAEVVSTVTVPIITSSDDKKQQPKNHKKPSEPKKSEFLNIHQESSKKDQTKPVESSPQNEIIKSCIICKKDCPNVVECKDFKTLKVDQRWKMVKSKKLCRTCLRLHFGFCRQNKSCGVNNCSIKHHPLLHDEERVKKSESSSEMNGFHFPVKFNDITLLRIIPVILYGVGCSIKTFAFVDDGSTTTLIDERIANQLKVKGTPKELCLLWSGSVHRIEKNSQVITVGISSIRPNAIQYQLKGVKTVEKLAIPAQRLIREELCRKFPYLSNVSFDEYEVGLPGIPIGSNNPKIGLPIETVEGGDYEPIASRTRIGWTVYGPTRKLDSWKQFSNAHIVEECNCKREHDNDLHRYIKDYFSVENFGVQVNNFMNQDSKENDRAIEQLRNFTRKIENGYECGLLWKYDRFEIPDSYGMALRRLRCLENRRPEVVIAINKTITEYIAKGYVTKLNEEEIHQTNQRVWYLPIFVVTHPKKPEKIRTVFDAAAKVNGISLNDLLLKGPDLLVSLIDILRRFREKKIAAVGDIREMYHQIKTRAEDRNCQRFLWKNGENRKPDVYVMNVMTFGATCSPSIAHYVKNYNASQFAEKFPQAVETITRNHYVDDMMEGSHTEEEMIKLIDEVKMIHSKGGFEIRNFLSNSKAVMSALGSGNETEGKSKGITPEKDINIERVLGMWWNIQTDCFTFSLKYSPVNEKILIGKKLPTKREMLKLLMSIFDPLGLISHFLIHLKIVIQEIWRTALQWDQQISDPKIISHWNRWLEVLPKVEEIQIPRLYTIKISPDTSTSVELHIFVDAGDEAFGAVCYLRVEDEDGVDCSLVGSKARVAPIKYLSIPRKELQAAVLGTRLSSSINSSQNLVINRKVFWSDSRTVLSWLHADHRKYHQFVAHRIGEILEGTEQNDWRWIPSKLNVADEMTKWKKPPSFETSDRWFSGPEFLKLSEEYWPKLNGNIEETEEEMKSNFSHSEITVARLINPTRFSNWNRMLRALAYVVRYVRLLKAKIQKQSMKHKHLSQEELTQARNLLIRQAQFDEYSEEIVNLVLNKDRQLDQQKFITKSSPIYLCLPYLDDEGILRVSGRIDLAENIHDAMKRPIILPRKHRITNLLMHCYHRIYHHRNNETVVNELRQKFHIPKLRVALKSIIKHDCQSCKNRKAKPEPPQMAQLPVSRLAVGFRPYTYTGVDFFGPLEVVVGRHTEKRWGCLFTCLTIRAVHIEVAFTLSTESFIKCLRNFIALCGRPNEMYSDTGTNFVGANNELTRISDIIDFERVATEFTTSYSKWNFNPPHAPHFGGAWERLVRSVKTSLYEIMPTRRPNDETLRNLLMEVQNVINSRPLTFIPLDNDNDEALTPNHFLLGSSNGNKPPGSFEFDGPILRSAWQENQRLTNHFWQRFVKEYLPTLTRRTKWLQPVQPLEIGDVALDIDSAYPRNSYPKVRIVDRKMDSTGQVRRVLVQYANKSMLWRPASTVARLDILSKDSASDTRVSGSNPVLKDIQPDVHPTIIPKVIAAETNLATPQLVVPSEKVLTGKKFSDKTEGNVASPRQSARIANQIKRERMRNDKTTSFRR